VFLEYYTKYLITKKPPISKTVNAIASQLKYLSINDFICGPNFHIKKATRKNLAPRLITDATMNIRILILNAPDEMVIIL
jgi:hypothetical protein